MTTIIISSLEAAEQAYKLHNPGFVISILDCDDCEPASFAGLAENRHMKLDGGADDEVKWCPKILDFAKSWAESGEDVLIHCHRGVARSTAIAYILMCVRDNKECECKIAEQLRSMAPHADPNLLLVSEADKILGRDDRMVGAVLDMCPCCGTVGAPIVTLPLDR